MADFKAIVGGIFLTFQQAWMDRDCGYMEILETEKMFRIHKEKIDNYIKDHTLFVAERIDITKIRLASYKVMDNYEYLIVVLDAMMRNYLVNEDTKQIISGNSKEDWKLSYNLTFIRQVGFETKKAGEAIHTTNCPCCGAPTEITLFDHCPYCNGIIINENFK